MHPLTVMDATTIAEVARSDALMGNGENALNQIEAAIGRIDDGSYGRCGTCGVQVPKVHCLWRNQPFTPISTQLQTEDSQ